MKLKQRQPSRKNVHMPIEPNKQQRSMVEKIPNDRVSSPDALLNDGDDAFQSDQIIQDQMKEIVLDEENSQESDQQTESVPQENAQNSKNSIQKEEEQREKLTNHYLHEFYEYVLRPIAKSLIMYGILFFFLFVFIKAFWIYEDIQYRKYSQEKYLKSLMYQKTASIQKDYQHSFFFLDSVMNVFQQKVSSFAVQTQSQTYCQDFDSRYLCNIQNNCSQSLYRAVDLYYDLLTIDLVMLMTHLDVKNVFLFSESEDGFVEFNLNKIRDEQNINIQPYTQDKNLILSYEETEILANYIKTFNQNSTSAIPSYLDSQSSKSKPYEMFEVYIYQPNATQLVLTEAKETYQVYCLEIPLNYSGTTSGKVCITIPSFNKLQNSSNILYFKTNFPQIEIQNKTIISVTYNTYYIENFYNTFQTFVKTQVMPIFPQFHLDQEVIIKCLEFHDSFDEMFAEDFVQLEIFRCYPSDYFHMFVGKYVFAWSVQEADKFSYYASPYSLNPEEVFKFESLIIPNQTYFSDLHEIYSQGIESIETTIKLIGILFIAVLFSFETSNYMIRTKMIESLMTLKKLSKLVISIDDVKKSENEFKKILKQLQDKYQIPRTQIFGVFIGYLQKFLWIKKLYDYNRRYSQQKQKKSRLLFEGLKLFKYTNDETEVLSYLNTKNPQFLSEIQMIRSSSEKGSKKKYSTDAIEYNLQNDDTTAMNYKKYPAVLIYIYQELIILELKKIQNFQNVKVLSKRRNSSKRPQNQMHILHEIDNDRQSEPKYHYQSSDHNYSQDLSIYGQQLPQISIMDSQPRQNRGVRFSNQIQLRGFNQQDEKKSKFRQHILSNSSIGKKSELKSVKSIDSDLKKKLEESERISKSQEDSIIAGSSKKLKRQMTIKNILRGDQSIHDGLKTMKFDESLNLYEQKSNINKYQVLESSMMQKSMSLSVDQLYYTQKQILEETIKSYERITQHYEELIEIKEQNLDKMICSKTISPEEEKQKINQIYSIQIKRLKVCFKYLKMLLDEYRGDEIDFEERGINLNFDHLTFYQSNYEIHQSLLDKSVLFKMKIYICLGKAISYKQLEQICRSEDIQVCLESNYLYAEQLSKLEPFLDFQVINICNNCISNYDTSITFKRKCLQLMIKTLARRKDEFLSEIDQLQLIKRYYNRKHKKFYFIADMTESYDIFTPILTKIYELMGKMDLMQIYNLSMNQNLEDMELVREIIKPQTSEAFLSLFEQLTLENEKSKQKNSSKMIHKRMVYEKDFNQILDQIQKDQTQFSSFLVIILGGDQLSNHSSIMTDDVDSSNNQRQLNQLLYSEINRKIQKNYYHIVEIGTHLNNFMTKQGNHIFQLGKLKKHIKNCSDLLEIDLIKKNLTEHFVELEKFING